MLVRLLSIEDDARELHPVTLVRGLLETRTDPAASFAVPSHRAPIPNASEAVEYRLERFVAVVGASRGALAPIAFGALATAPAVPVAIGSRLATLTNGSGVWTRRSARLEMRALKKLPGAILSLVRVLRVLMPSVVRELVVGPAVRRPLPGLT